MKGNKPLVELIGVNAGYRNACILENVNLRVLEGDFIGIAGANGSGKSTLLKTIAGLLPPLTGRLERREDLHRTAYVPQRHHLPTHVHVPVIEAVTMILAGEGLPPGEERRRAMEALRYTRTEELADRGLAELSGGQLQRVLLARALALDTPLILLDEPTDGLDLPAEIEAMQLIRRLNEQGKAVVMVSHSLETISACARRIVILRPPHVHSVLREELSEPSTLRRIYGERTPLSVLKARLAGNTGTNGGRTVNTEGAPPKGGA